MSHKRNNRNKSKQRKPRSLADIVREKTNDGEVIVDFYLDVVRGKLDDEGFEVCHKLEAAEQVHAIAPGLVAEYIAQLTGIECNHAIRRRRTRPTTVVPAESLAPEQSGAGTHPRPDSNNANSARARHQALEYLASALAAPSLADDPRVAGIVRGSTDHGKTVVSFLLHVMHGVVRGFRPRHRVQAASELLGHIARDELARSGSLLTEPALNAVEGTKIVRPEPVEGPGPSVIPAKAGIQVGGDEEGLPSEPTQADDQEDPDTERGAYDIQGDPTVIPAKSLPRTRYGAGIQVDPTVIPAEAGIQDGGDGEGLPSDHPKQTTRKTRTPTAAPTTSTARSPTPSTTRPTQYTSSYRHTTRSPKPSTPKTTTTITTTKSATGYPARCATPTASTSGSTPRHIPNRSEDDSAPNGAAAPRQRAKASG